MSIVAWLCCLSPERAEGWLHWKARTPLTCFVPLQRQSTPMFLLAVLSELFCDFPQMCVPEVSHILLYARQKGSVISQEALPEPAAVPVGYGKHRMIWSEDRMISSAWVVPITYQGGHSYIGNFTNVALVRYCEWLILFSSLMVGVGLCQADSRWFFSVVCSCEL